LTRKDGTFVVAGWEGRGRSGGRDGDGCRESRKGAEGKRGEKNTAGIGKQKSEKIYPIDRSLKWLLNNSPTDSSLQK
jgi:hypothetical protein